MQRRTFACCLAALALAGLALGARAQDADAPLVVAPKIIEALTSKDIVVDRPGAAARRGPAIDLQVQFTFDSAELLPQGKRQLDELAMALAHKSLAGWAFVLAGHTDRVGDANYNVRLSLARAESVKSYLLQAHGVLPERLQTIGYGFSRLLDPAHPSAALNRRVEVRRVAAAPAGRAQPASASSGRIVPTPR